MFLCKPLQNALLGHGRWSRRGQRCWDPFSRGGPATASPSVQLQPSGFGRYEPPDFGQEEMPGDGEEDDLMYQEPEMVWLGQVVSEILWELRSCFFLVIATGSTQHWDFCAFTSAFCLGGSKSQLLRVLWWKGGLVECFGIYCRPANAVSQEDAPKPPPEDDDNDHQAP